MNSQSEARERARLSQGKVSLIFRKLVGNQWEAKEEGRSSQPGVAARRSGSRGGGGLPAAGGARLAAAPRRRRCAAGEAETPPLSRPRLQASALPLGRAAAGSNGQVPREPGWVGRVPAALCVRPSVRTSRGVRLGAGPVPPRGAPLRCPCPGRGSARGAVAAPGPAPPRASFPRVVRGAPPSRGRSGGRGGGAGPGRGRVVRPGASPSGLVCGAGSGGSSPPREKGRRGGPVAALGLVPKAARFGAVMRSCFPR